MRCPWKAACMNEQCLLAHNEWYDKELSLSLSWLSFFNDWWKSVTPNGHDLLHALISAGERSGSIASSSADRRETVQGDRAKLLLDAEMTPDKVSNSSNPAPATTSSSVGGTTTAAVAATAAAAGKVTTQNTLGTTGTLGTPQKQLFLRAAATAATATAAATGTATATPPTANGPTRIPQRRGPLNLTLDLSVTNSPTCEVIENATVTSKEGVVRNDAGGVESRHIGSALLGLSSPPPPSGAVSGFKDQLPDTLACFLTVLALCHQSSCSYRDSRDSPHKLCPQKAPSTLNPMVVLPQTARWRK